MFFKSVMACVALAVAVPAAAQLMTSIRAQDVGKTRPTLRVVPLALPPAVKIARIKTLGPQVSNLTASSPVVSLNAKLVTQNNFFLVANGYLYSNPMGPHFELGPDNWLTVSSDYLTAGKMYLVDFYVYPFHSAKTVKVSYLRYGSAVPDVKVTTEVAIVDQHALLLVPASAGTQFNATVFGDAEGSAVFGVDVSVLN